MAKKNMDDVKRLIDIENEKRSLKYDEVNEISHESPENSANCFSEEAFFENALKRVSVQAFDALLTCGVRDLNGLLRLTSEEMRNVGLPKNIISELMNIPLLFKKEEAKSGQQNFNFNQNDFSVHAVDELQYELTTKTDNSTHDLNNGTPIPDVYISKLPTRTKNVLSRENILTIKHLLEFKEEDLFNIWGIGRKTVFDLMRLQTKLTNIPSQIIQTSVADAEQIKPLHDPTLKNFTPRVRCHSRTGEYWLSDPADWSLLSRTLLELFWLTLPSLNDSDYEADFTIGELGISDIDICKFCEIVLFPEDTADLLFTISLGRLLQITISDDTFIIMLDYLQRFTGHPNQSIKFAITAKVSDTPIFADIATDIIDAFRIPPSLLNQELFELLVGRTSPITWGNIANISERHVIKQFGFTLLGVKAIKHLWLLKEHALKLITRISSGLPTEAYSSFNNLVDCFVRSIIRKDKKGYHYPVLMGRLGFLDERRWTLEELGQRLNLTRERIRQIENIYVPTLEKPNVLERLKLLWYAVDETLKTSGGVCCVSEIADSLKISLKWSTIPSDEALASLFSLSVKYEIVWETPIRIIMPNHECVKCSEIRSSLTKTVEGQPNGTLLFEDAISKLHNFCQFHACEKSQDMINFSVGFLHYLDDEIEEIYADEDAFYTPFAWAQKYGSRRLILVETILRNAGRPMHFTEVHAEVNKDRPPHDQISERNVYASIERSPELLLWDRGTYIHRGHVTFPHDLIAKIEDEILRRLACNIPYLSVSGIFGLFKDDLIKRGVLSESALYTCLRESNSNALIYPDYPNVMKFGAGVRLPISLVLEEFVLAQEGFVTYEELRKYAVETLCVNEVIFVANHLPNTPNLLRMSRGEYIHLNQLGIDAVRLSPIADHLNRLLDNYDHIAVQRLYDEKKISCKLLGISTPMLLYSLIQFFYSDQFDFPRYPKLTRSGMTGGGVTTEIIRYILEKQAPCSFIELYQHFVDELGYKQMSVYNVHFNNQIIRYSGSVVVHLEALGWSDDKQAALEISAANHLNDRKSAGKPFGLISHLYDYMYDRLPELPDQISWTPTVIGELLCSEGKFRIVGTTRNTFVSVPNSFNIENLDDLLHYILDTEFDGAANIEQFISDMREEGILKKSLTSMMLGIDSRVIVEGNVVKLARLSNRVEGT